MTIFKWVPEAPKHLGVYAVKDKIGYVGNMTYSITDALKFETREECQKWCDDNPVPIFVPMQHGFE